MLNSQHTPGDRRWRLDARMRPIVLGSEPYSTEEHSCACEVMLKYSKHKRQTHGSDGSHALSTWLMNRTLFSGVSSEPYN